MNHDGGDFTILIVIAAYLLPTLIAGIRHHRNTAAIVATNLIFGWTGIGWAVAFIWSLTN